MAATRLRQRSTLRTRTPRHVARLPPQQSQPRTPQSQGLDHVTDALQQGHIGFEAAQLIARIATPTTERAWLDRATRRTFKHLREEVQAVEMLTRFAGQTDHLTHQPKPTSNRCKP